MSQETSTLLPSSRLFKTGLSSLEEKGRVNMTKSALKWYHDQKISSFFSLDFESVFAYHLTGKILSFEFYPKAVYFECKFWILQSAITHVQN